MLEIERQRKRKETNGKHRIGETLHLEHVHFSSCSIFAHKVAKHTRRMHRLAFWTLIPERLRYPVRCCGWWQWRPKGDGARGVHEVGGTAQRVEAKGEAARETVEEGARGEGRGHGASATRCYKGGYAAKSPQWAPRRLRRRIIHIRNGGTVIAGEHEAIHIIPRGPRLCCVFCDWSTTITDWRTEWRKGETRRSVCKGRRVASRGGGGLLEELGNVHASRAEIQVCLRIVHDNRFADNDRDYGKKKWWNLKIVANFLEFLNITSCICVPFPRPNSSRLEIIAISHSLYVN